MASQRSGAEKGNQRARKDFEEHFKTYSKYVDSVVETKGDLSEVRSHIHTLQQNFRPCRVGAAKAAEAQRLLGILKQRRDQGAKDVGRNTKTAVAADEAEAEAAGIGTQRELERGQTDKGNPLAHADKCRRLDALRGRCISAPMLDEQERKLGEEAGQPKALAMATAAPVPPPVRAEEDQSEVLPMETDDPGPLQFSVEAEHSAALLPDTVEPPPGGGEVVKSSTAALSSEVQPLPVAPSDDAQCTKDVGALAAYAGSSSPEPPFPDEALRAGGGRQPPRREVAVLPKYRLKDETVVAPYDPGTSALPLYRAVMMGVPGATRAYSEFLRKARAREQAVREAEIQFAKQSRVLQEEQKYNLWKIEETKEAWEKALAEWHYRQRELHEYSKKENAPWLSKLQSEARLGKPIGTVLSHPFGFRKHGSKSSCRDVGRQSYQSPRAKGILSQSDSDEGMCSHLGGSLRAPKPKSQKSLHRGRI